MLRSVLYKSYRTAQHTTQARSSNFGRATSQSSILPRYRYLQTTSLLKMPSDKADPTTETLPAEQANPAAPAPQVGAEGAGAAAEGGDVGEDGKPSKKGGELCSILVGQEGGDAEPRYSKEGGQGG